MRVLVTRAQPEADRTAERLLALGHTPLVAPLLSIRNREGAGLSLIGVQGILVTSANGVRALAERSTSRDLTIYAVGAQTARAAESAGFSAVRSADGDAAALAKAVSGWADPGAGELLYVSGDKIASDLLTPLKAQGFSVRREILYDVIAAKELPEPVISAVSHHRLDAVLLFSANSARIFRDCVVAAALEESCAPLIAICLSHAVAEALALLQFRECRVAARPNLESLLLRLDS